MKHRDIIVSSKCDLTWRRICHIVGNPTRWLIFFIPWAQIPIYRLKWRIEAAKSGHTIIYCLNEIDRTYPIFFVIFGSSNSRSFERCYAVLCVSNYWTLTVTISVKTGGAAVSQEYSKALEEMMDKIKRGASLRPVLKPVKKVVQ